jgi:hypothetical protein
LTQSNQIHSEATSLFYLASQQNNNPIFERSRAILQMGAWAGMVVQYGQQAGLITGLCQSFDGEHPCPVCKAIQEGEKQEGTKAPLLNTEPKKGYLADCNISKSIGVGLK